VATYHANESLSFTAAARYSGRQFNTLDNTDPNGFAYTGTSSFFVADLRARWQFAKDWSAALGVDNLNNKTYWAFHPYPQRTIVAELRWGKK
jgi:iron complex outermembrane receptor protein